MKLLLFALLAATAFAQDQLAKDQPIKFRGAYLGQPVSDYGDCAAGKLKVRAEGFKTHGKICDGSKGIIYHVKVRGFLNAKDDGETFYVEDQRIVRIKILIPNGDWGKVRYDLTQKLGEPLSEVPTVYQNGFGAKWEFDRGFWVRGDIVAAAGIKVANIAGEAITKPFSNVPDTEGIEITITSAERAKLPNTRPNSLD